MEIFGYTFQNDELLETALTTPSYRMQFPEARDNQRLEFLGDAVLGLMCAERLFRECPNEKEGALTVRRTHMVSSAALCAAAARHGLAARLKRNKGATPLPENSKTLADAIEAIVGAAYVDGGLEAARNVVKALDLESRAECGAWSSNPKGDLQICTQAMKPRRHPVYTLVNVAGKAHAPTFTVKVAVEGHGEATASAHSRQEAETMAAAKLLAGIRGASGTRGAKNTPAKQPQD